MLCSQMDWFDADFDLQVTTGNETLTQDPNFYPYEKDGILGLMIISSFLDSTYTCAIDEVKLGNTSLSIYPQYLITEDSLGESCHTSKMFLEPLGIS